MRINYPRNQYQGIRRFLPSWKFMVGSFAIGFFLAALTLTILVQRTAIPAPNEISTANATVVYYNDGKYEIGRIGEYNRVEVNLAQIPLITQRAVLAAEDKDFYSHSGFSLTGIGRALFNNLTSGSTQGASTITQQYAKNAYLSSEQTVTRKVKELVLALKLETSNSKDKILENYLNTVYFGRGAYGIQAAAKAYFGKDVSGLDVQQSAFLAALLKSPEGFAPEVDLPRLTVRYEYVLDQMVQAGWLDNANLEFPTYRPKNTENRLGGPRGYILAEVKKELEKLGYDESSLGVAGLQIITTIDRKSQKAAEKAVEKEGPETGTEGLRIGLAAVRPGTGEIVAMYGGPDYVTEPLNNATQAIAQAGSTFKPFALAAAAEREIPLDTIYRGKNGIDVSGYTVNNYGNTSFGKVTLLQATELSINTAYVELAYGLGIDAVIDAAIAAGIPEDAAGIERNLTFVLGSASPHVIDVANAYATFAAEGIKAEPFLVSRIVGANGGLIYEAVPTTESAFSVEAMRVVNYAMQRVVTNGTGTTALGVGRAVAGKTGTTDENRSAWFAGYTPNLSAVVMLMKQDENGNPVSLSGTGGLSSVTGGSFPARIFTAFMKAALADVPVVNFNRPTKLPTVTASPTESLLPSETPTPSETPSETATPTETAEPEPTDTEAP
ncbi:MAG: hypothetical protein RL038_1299 [Actinomycetota bacterium]